MPEFKNRAQRRAEKYGHRSGGMIFTGRGQSKNGTKKTGFGENVRERMPEGYQRDCDNHEDH